MVEKSVGNGDINGYDEQFSNICSGVQTELFCTTPSADPGGAAGSASPLQVSGYSTT